MPSSNAFPSLATVCDRFRPLPGKNLLDRKEDFDSDLREPSTPLLLFMRKKFLSF